MSLDILFCSVPRLDLSCPMLGISLLSAIAKRAGFTSRVLDLNADLGRRYRQFFPEISWGDLEPVFSDPDSFAAHKDVFEILTNEWCEKIIALDPEIVGISLFTQRNRFVAIELCRKLKFKCPQIKLLIGGADCIHSFRSFLASGLIDFYILGEADEAIVELLRGNTQFRGINSLAQPVENLSDIPIPDYSDLDLSLYHNQPPAFFVATSRGCPYRCTFCDVRSIWQSYRMRDPVLVLSEIRFYVREYGASRIIFTDSLLNGDIGHYRTLLSGLARIREEVDGRLSWEGFCVVTSSRKMSLEDFILLKASGCERIKIGVESGSPKVRRHMRKPFRPKDLDYFLSQASRAGVGVDLMLMVGYPTETLEDFERTKEMLQGYRSFAADGTIQFIRIDMTHVANTQPIFQMQKELSLNMNGASGMWSVPGLDIHERLRRYFELRDYALNLGYKIMAVQDSERQATYRRLSLK